MLTTEKNEPGTSWLDRSLDSLFKLRWENVIFLVILLVAILSRFYDLGARVMSHDESLTLTFRGNCIEPGATSIHR